MEQQSSNETTAESAFKAALADFGVQSDEIDELYFYMRGACKYFSDSKTPTQVADAFVSVIKKLHESGQTLRPENVMDYATKLLQEDSAS